MGALPTLRAATDPGVLGGQYYGPGGFFGARGYPKLAESSGQSHDTAIQRRLWTVSEELTGVTFPVVRPGLGRRQSVMTDEAHPHRKTEDPARAPLA